MTDFEIISLLREWRGHIADVYNRRGRSDVYIPAEAGRHVCHGCGHPDPAYITDGLCRRCMEQYENALKKLGGEQ